MPRRYGKMTRFVLLNLYLRDAYSAADLKTKERKAVRQMRRKPLSKEERTAHITVGPGHTPLKPWTTEEAEAHKRARLEDE